jgi:hypothetical protein
MSQLLIQDKLASIIAEIDRTGHADIMRLTVLKKWFKHPKRLAAFGLWVAQRAVARGDAATGAAKDLFTQAQALLIDNTPAGSRPSWEEAERLHRRLRLFQNRFQRQTWGPVRIIDSWELLLIEEGLNLYLNVNASPTDGYRLAVDDCAHYDPRFGQDLNGPSRAKIEALIGFIATIEARSG